MEPVGGTEGGVALSRASARDNKLIIVNGTEVTDADSGDCYFVKAREVGIFVVPVPNNTASAPDVGDGSDSDLLDLDEEVGEVDIEDAFNLDKPSGCEVRYVEGLPVE